MSLVHCFGEANKAEFVCGLLGVMAYLCDKLFKCPEIITQSFTLGDFICDSSYVVSYAGETIVGDHNHIGARSEIEMMWGNVDRALHLQNVSNTMRSDPPLAKLFDGCSEHKKIGPKKTNFVCGLLGSFGFICGGLKCPELVTETFVTGDFICDLSSVIKFAGATALGKGDHKQLFLPYHKSKSRSSQRPTLQEMAGSYTYPYFMSIDSNLIPANNTLIS